MEHYLDNSATTVASLAAAKKAFEMMTENYANPSSLHYRGMLAEQELEKARKAVAKQLFAQTDEIIFTSGGTEANNLALFGTAYAKKRRGTKIVTTSIEHSSIMESCKRLEQEGFEIAYVSPRQDGVVHTEDILAEVNDNTVLVSVMYVNNETGAIMPVAEIFDAVKGKKSDIICHTDAVQAFGKIAVNPKKLGADLVSVSAHKVHSPKGCGAIYIKKGVRLVPRTYGGEQEKKIRPGTEPLPLIAAFGVACNEFAIEKNYEKVAELCEYAKNQLTKIDGVVINSPQNALPYVLNFSAGKVRSETMLHFLEEYEIYVSSGSACAKGAPSYVLSSMGYGSYRADSALRVSFSKLNTKEDVDALCTTLAKGLKVLVHR